MYRSFSLLLLALALLTLSIPTGATVIYVSGDQSGTWSADTVIVTAEVRVPPGQSLTILPGVEVLFSVYCKLIVDSAAILLAVGTEEDSIRIDELTQGIGWEGIRFLKSSDSSHVIYCHITHARTSGVGLDRSGGGICCYYSSPTIENSLIDSCKAPSQGQGGGIYCEQSSAAIIGNTITKNLAGTLGWSGSGGGISCSYASPDIENNTISENSVGGFGGGIYCNYSSPTINNNIIINNSARYDGGGISCTYSDCAIIGNAIIANSAHYEGGWGGGIYCNRSNPTISENTLMKNFAANDGGGIFCDDISSPTISGNTLIENIANTVGGGICCYMGSDASISDNTISGNYSDYMGGGIYCYPYSNPTISGNTISGNSTPFYGGGIYCYNSSTTLVNCILWANTPNQITGTLTVTYSDIQDGYAGTGNINAYPAFVDTAQHDYRLQWGSPCIDTGDPNPIYNDPDLTRADMGAWYYDQSMPVRILLTPYNAPIKIPANGGSFQFALHVTNSDNVVHSTTAWCNVTLPSGSIVGPVIGPVTIPVGAGQTLSRLRIQVVPANAPAGMYHYNAYAVAVGDTSEDSFVFTKLGVAAESRHYVGDWGLGIGGWTNTGEDFGELQGVQLSEWTPTENAPTPPMTSDLCVTVSPNPANPTTAISFELRAASFVSLKVYDTAGRLVTTLVNGWRESGEQQVTFDGSNLASGVYLYRLEAGGATAVGKLVLLK